MRCSIQINMRRPTILCNGKNGYYNILIVKIKVRNKYMEITKEMTITLTPKEVEKIIIEHLASQNINDVIEVYFNIKGYNDQTDWRGEYPLEYKFENVICKCITK